MKECLCGIEEVVGLNPIEGSNIKYSMNNKYDKYYASSRRTKTLGEIINFIESTVTKIWHALR